MMNDTNDNIQKLLQEIKRISDRIPSDLGGGSPLPKTFLMACIALECELRTYVEIGVYRGKSFFPMAYMVKKLGGKAFGIDAYDYEIAKEYDVDPSVGFDVNEFLAKLDFSQIYSDVKILQKDLGLMDHSEIIKDDSKKAVHYFRENQIVIDMLHIDGNHDTPAVQADVDAYVPLVKDGGFIVIDDVHWESVRRVYHLLEQKYPVVFNDGYFAILLKQGENKHILPVQRFHYDAIYSLASLTSVIQEKDKLFNELSTKITEKESLINVLIEHEKDQGRLLLTLTDQINESNREINELKTQLQKIKEESHALEIKFVDLSRNYQNLTSQALENENKLQILGNQSNELREQIAEKDRQINNLNYMISEIYRSTSWKVTRPLRSVKPFARKAWSTINTLTIGHKEKKSRFRPRKTTRQKMISVVVTAYNHEKYIAQCLDSILMQKGYFQLEIILGDDCSTDRTAEIIARYQKLYPKLIKVMPNEVNLGVTKNLERCLDACRGEYIAICEGDDYWIDEYKLQKQMEFLEDHPDYSMCFSGLLLRYEDSGKLIPFESQAQLKKQAITTADLVTENIIGNFSCCMYRSKTIQKLPKKLFNIYTVDWMLNMACGEQGPIGFLPEAMSVYRIHSNGAWSGKDELNQINFLLPLLDTYNMLLDNKYKDDFINLKEKLLKRKEHLLSNKAASTISQQDGFKTSQPSDPHSQVKLLSGIEKDRTSLDY